MGFWDVVNSEIRRQKITQEWVAQKAGMDHGTFRSAVSKNQQPGIKRAIKIAKALETTVEYLVDGESGQEYVRQVIAREGRLYRPPDQIVGILDDLAALDDEEVARFAKQIHVIAEDARAAAMEDKKSDLPS